MDPLVPAAVPAGQAFDGGAAPQQVGGLLVGFEKARGADAGKGGDGLADPGFIEPRSAVVVLVDDLELCPEPVFEDDFAEAGTAGFLRIDGCWRARRSAFEVRPAMFLSWSISGRSTSSYSGPSVIYFACFVPACAALFGPAVMAT
jgi:hypothetical protein